LIFESFHIECGFSLSKVSAFVVLLRRKLNTIRRVSENPDEIRSLILARLPSISPTSYWLRWLYPAWWKYICYPLTRWFTTPSAALRINRANRFLIRVPNTAGIGDQIVTSWSETYLLAREFELKFVHHPFVRSPHDPDTDWETFLGFGNGEVEANQVLSNVALKTVWLPPVSLADQRNITLFHRIINQIYPEDNVSFRLARNAYFEADIDQSELMPAVYAKKYEAARREYPFDFNLQHKYLNVGVHVRRGDVNSLKEKDLHQWKRRWISDEYYLNALRDLLTVVDKAPFQVHIFSDGAESEFSAFSQVCQCVFHLQEDPRSAFHAMVSSDILISGSSSFAICAGKISKGIKLIGREFDSSQFRLFVPNTSDWVKIETTGHLSDGAKKHIREELIRRGIATRLRLDLFHEY
jgi:hypothetical protein